MPCPIGKHLLTAFESGIDEEYNGNCFIAEFWSLIKGKLNRSTTVLPIVDEEYELFFQFLDGLVNIQQFRLYLITVPHGLLKQRLERRLLVCWESGEQTFRTRDL